jgi:hypothetical protein
MPIRKALTIFCAGLVLFFFLLPVTGEAQSLKVTLLGTGDPVPRIDRFGPSTLVQTCACPGGGCAEVWGGNRRLVV